MESKDIIKKALSKELPEYKFETPSKRAPQDILLSTSVCYDLFSSFFSNQINYDNASFYLITEGSNVDRIVRLSTLMPSPITFTNLNSSVYQMSHGVWNENGKNIEWELNCHLPSEGFFKNYGELLAEGIIQYYPNTAYYIINPDGSCEWSKRYTIDHPNTVYEAGSINSISRLFDKVITLDIPYIDAPSITDFSKITIDNIDSLNNFRRLFKKEILNIDFSKEKEKAELECTLNDSVNQLGVKYKQECSKLKKSLLVGTVATVATSLLIFSDINQLLNCLSGLTEGTGLIYFIKTIYDFHIEKIAIKENDLYFLWLLKKAKE